MANPRASPHNPDIFEVWGDCEIPGWDTADTNRWNLWLNGAALFLYFVNEGISERIKAEVQKTIAEAKAGEITAKQAIYRIGLQNIIRLEEWPEIQEAVRRDGRMVGAFLFSSSGKTPHN